MDSLYKKLKSAAACKANESLARHSTFRLGGPAKYFCVPENKNELSQILGLINEAGENFLMIGGGSNTLFPDEGFEGAVIKFNGRNVGFKTERATGGAKKIICSAEAGAITADVARNCVEHGAAGFEWGVGVPGTIGGAVCGNAGAWIPAPNGSKTAHSAKIGGEMNDIVKSVQVWYNGDVENWPASECCFAYRDSNFKRNGAIILSAELELACAEDGEQHACAKQKSAALMLEFLKYRTKTQPKISSCGCTFKNPLVSGARLSAGKLIDDAGCKGMKVGGAEVSSLHGNFILNTGSATAADIKQLIQKIKDRVTEKFGVELEEEIRII